MSDLDLEVEVGASPAAVWAVLADVHRIPEWLTVHDRFEDLPDEMREGTELRHHVAAGDVASEVRWTVAAFEPDSRLVLDGTSTGGAGVRIDVRLEAHGEGTRLVAATDYDLPGGPVGKALAKVAEPKAREEAETSLDRLRGLVEP